MKRHARLLVAAALAALVDGAAAADPATSWQLVAGVTSGFSDNPYLERDGRSAATLGVSLQPEVRIATARATTDLSATLDYTKYLNNYSDAHDIGLTASHVNHLTSTLTANAGLSYTDATSSLLQPLDSNIDIISSKQKIRSFSGSGGLDWQMDEKDDVSASVNYSRSDYPGSIQRLSNFDSYSAQLAYNRVLSSRLSAGVTVSGQRTLSDAYPDSTVYSTRATGKYQINAHWSLNGSLGINFEDQEIGRQHSRSTALSFDANLCGTYPRFNVCVQASRDTSPSGYGGVRTRSQAGASGSYSLNEHSSVSGNVSYTKDTSASGNPIYGVPNLSLLEADLNYSHDLTARLAFTAGAGYQRRTYETAGSGHGFNVTAGLRITLGHLIS